MKTVKLTCLAVTIVIAMTFSALVHVSLDGTRQILETKVLELKR
jgi:hypothetical protein